MELSLHLGPSKWLRAKGDGKGMRKSGGEEKLGRDELRGESRQSFLPVTDHSGRCPGHG